MWGKMARFSEKYIRETFPLFIFFLVIALVQINSHIPVCPIPRPSIDTF